MCRSHQQSPLIGKPRKCKTSFMGYWTSKLLSAAMKRFDSIFNVWQTLNQEKKIDLPAPQNAPG